MIRAVARALVLVLCSAAIALLSACSDGTSDRTSNGNRQVIRGDESVQDNFSAAALGRLVDAQSECASEDRILAAGPDPATVRSAASHGLEASSLVVVSCVPNTGTAFDFVAGCRAGEWLLGVDAWEGTGISCR